MTAISEAVKRQRWRSRALQEGMRRVGGSCYQSELAGFHYKVHGETVQEV